MMSVDCYMGFVRDGSTISSSIISSSCLEEGGEDVILVWHCKTLLVCICGGMGSKILS